MSMRWRWWIIRTGEEVCYEASCDFCQMLLIMIGSSMRWRWWIVRTGEKVCYEVSCDFCQMLLTMIGIRFWIGCCCLGGRLLMMNLLKKYRMMGGTYWDDEWTFWGSWAWVLYLDSSHGKRWKPGSKFQDWRTSALRSRVRRVASMTTFVHENLFDGRLEIWERNCCCESLNW